MSLLAVNCKLTENLQKKKKTQQTYYNLIGNNVLVFIIRKVHFWKRCNILHEPAISSNMTQLWHHLGLDRADQQLLDAAAFWRFLIKMYLYCYLEGSSAKTVWRERL